MTGTWKELTREELESRILESLTDKWATPKQLEPILRIPWRVLMRALPRMQLLGKVEGRLEHVTGLRQRRRIQRRYRLPLQVSCAVYDLLVPRVDVSAFKVISVREHRCDDEAPPRRLALGYRC